MLLHAQADRELPPAHQRPLLDRIESLWARAYNKILKVAGAIADLDGSEDFPTHHLGEAINYRPLDCNLESVRPWKRAMVGLHRR